MFKYNKLRYWLGIACVVKKGNKFAVSKVGILGRSFLGKKSATWWHNMYDLENYIGLYNTEEEAYNAYVLKCKNIPV